MKSIGSSRGSIRAVALLASSMLLSVCVANAPAAVLNTFSFTGSYQVNGSTHYTSCTAILESWTPGVPVDTRRIAYGGRIGCTSTNVTITGQAFVENLRTDGTYVPVAYGPSGTTNDGEHRSFAYFVRPSDNYNQRVQYAVTLKLQSDIPSRWESTPGTSVDGSKCSQADARTVTCGLVTQAFSYIPDPGPSSDAGADAQLDNAEAAALQGLEYDTGDSIDQCVAEVACASTTARDPGAPSGNTYYAGSRSGSCQSFRGGVNVYEAPGDNQIAYLENGHYLTQTRNVMTYCRGNPQQYGTYFQLASFKRNTQTGHPVPGTVGSAQLDPGGTLFHDFDRPHVVESGCGTYLSFYTNPNQDLFVRCAYHWVASQD